MSNILIFGGGDMATKGIQPVVGGEVLSAEECDVTNPDQIQAVLLEAKPEVIINCAGISLPAPLALADDEDLFQEMLVNQLGSFYLAKYAIHTGVKKMIFIASVAGMYGKPEHAGYSASKGGVISLVQSLGMEGYDAYAISPGRVDTRMREKDYPGEDPRTRLEPLEIGTLVADILAGNYEPGDNIVIRRIGYETVPYRVDKGEPWREYLKVGQPKTL